MARVLERGRHAGAEPIAGTHADAAAAAAAAQVARIVVLPDGGPPQAQQAEAGESCGAREGGRDERCSRGREGRPHAP